MPSGYLATDNPQGPKDILVSDTSGRQCTLERRKVYQSLVLTPTTCFAVLLSSMLLIGSFRSCYDSLSL